jgi:hypothetical protein
MARKNARRRRAVKLQAALVALAKHKNPATVACEGHLRSSHKTALLATQRLSAPKSLRLGGKGKPGEAPPLIGGRGSIGRVVAGKLKPKLGKKLWSAT